VHSRTAITPLEFVHSWDQSREFGARMNFVSELQSEKKLVDVRGFEPATPCLQSLALHSRKTLNSFVGVGYTSFQ